MDKNALCGMNMVLRGIYYSFLALVVLCLLIIFFAVSNTPEVATDWSLTRNDIIRAKQILNAGSKIKPDEMGTIELSHADLNLAANYLLNRYSKSAVQIVLKENKLKFIVTATLPQNSIGKYLNVSFRLSNIDGKPLPSITKFRAGKLWLPAYPCAWLIDNIIRHSALNNYFLLATRPLKAIKIDADKLTITYFSDVTTLLQARNFLTQNDDSALLKLYQQKIADIVVQHDAKWRLSLAELLQPLFAFAYQHASLETAIEENRVIIMAVNHYVNKKETERFLAAQTEPRKGKQFRAFLYKRTDLAQHFIASAALTVSTNKHIAKAIGEEKELTDAQVGSGFSFIDLAADKAGTRFAELAQSSPENARKMQKLMADINDYRDFMPDPTDLPEKMNEADFKKRFGSPQDAAYLQLSQQIDARIAAMRIYKAFEPTK